MEILTLLIFISVLTSSIIFGLPLLAALTAGFFIFSGYAMLKGFKAKEIGRMALRGARTVRTILTTFIFIGILTGLWRACGTIAVIVHYSSSFLRPEIFFLVTFLLNCLVSVLTGTALGTAATMGVISMSVGLSMDLPPALLGGAILAGVYFGDRISPVSTSAILVAGITGTDLYGNIRRMIPPSIAPFLISCVIYLMLGMTSSAGCEAVDTSSLFGSEFVLSPYALIPALLILLFAFFRVDVRVNMLISIAAACVICCVVQDTDVSAMAGYALTGFHASDSQVARIMDGGGLLSMAKPFGIVLISSTYAGIFRDTGLLDKPKALESRLAGRFTETGAVLFTSIIVSAVCCNQSLSVMIAHQLCEDLDDDNEKLALCLENTVIVISPLIPWNIAGAVPLAAVGAPVSSIPASFFLYLLPLASLAWALFKHKTDIAK